MSRRSFATALSVGAVLALSIPVQASEEPARVTVPLEEYERIKHEGDRPSLTVIDTLRIGGGFARRDLSVAFTGRATGHMPTVAVLSGAEIGLHGCEGEALLTRGEGGQWSLTPLAPRFTLKCQLAASGSDRLEMSATGAVLWVDSEVADGEFVWAGAAASGERSFTIVRVTAAESAEVVPPSATARYRISLHPEETRFRYELEVRNPNRAHHGFDLTLASGEHVSQVDARATYEIEGGRYRFDLPPGESTIAIAGTLGSNAFTPPVDASLQYALLEAHPLLRPVVAGAAKRISPQETGMSAQFRGAQAFLLGVKEPLTWTVTRLEALRTTSFAVRSAEHRFFIDAEGTAMGETELVLDNQGASDIELPMKAEPTFASLNNEPVLLTRNAQGNLWLPLSQGTQTLLVQHRQKLNRRPFRAWGELLLPELSVPATRAGVELRYPAQWTPLYQSYSSETKTMAPSLADLFLALVLLVWSERVLCALGFSRVRRLLVAALLAALSLSSTWLSGALFAADIAGTLAWMVAIFQGKRRGGLRLALAIAVAVLASVGVAGAMLVAGLSATRGSEMVASSRNSLDNNGIPAQSYGRTVNNPVPVSPAGPAYQGLPAKFEMPWGATRERFELEMLKTGERTPVEVVLLQVAGKFWAEVLLGLAAALLALSQLGRIAAGLRHLFAPPPPADDARQPSKAA